MVLPNWTVLSSCSYSDASARFSSSTNALPQPGQYALASSTISLHLPHCFNPIPLIRLVANRAVLCGCKTGPRFQLGTQLKGGVMTYIAVSMIRLLIGQSHGR